MKDNDLLNVMIARRTDEAEGIISLELVPLPGKHLPTFGAGAHIDVHIRPGLVRQYSLSNNPEDADRYVTGILREPNSRGGSEAVHATFVEGALIQIGQPRNNFPLLESAGHSVLLAGGIGVTPILAMAWRLHTLGASFELHYCVRTEARAAFKALLADAPFRGRVALHIDDGPAEQRFDFEKHTPSFHAGAHLYACGPGGFMNYITESAKRRGWTPDHVHMEFFSANVDVTGDAFEVYAARSGLTITVPSDKTIAEVLLEHKVEVPLSCEQGVCGTCLTTVLEGIPEHRDLYLTDSEKMKNDRMTVCCSRAATHRLVLDI